MAVSWPAGFSGDVCCFEFRPLKHSTPATKEPNPSHSLCFDKGVLKVSGLGVGFVLDMVCSLS